MLRALWDLGTQFARDWFATNETNTMESSSESDLSSTDESDDEMVRMAALAIDDDPEVAFEADEPTAAPEFPNVVPVIANFERKLPGGLGCRARGGCKLGCASRADKIEDIRANMVQLYDEDNKSHKRTIQAYLFACKADDVGSVYNKKLNVKGQARKNKHVFLSNLGASVERVCKETFQYATVTSDKTIRSIGQHVFDHGMKEGVHRRKGKEHPSRYTSPLLLVHTWKLLEWLMCG